MYPVLFSLIFSCLCCYPAKDQHSSPPYTSFHRARDALLRMYADSRSVFVRWTDRWTSLVVFVFLMRHLANSRVERTSMLSMASLRGKRVPHTALQPHSWSQQESGASIAVTSGLVDRPRSISKRETVFYYARHSRWRSQAVTCCGSRKNMRAYVSVLNPRICQRIVPRRHNTPLKQPTGLKGLGASWWKQRKGQTKYPRPSKNTRNPCHKWHQKRHACQFRLPESQK